MQYPGQVSRLLSGICQGLDWKLKNDCICVCNESMLDERWSFLFINETLMIAKRASLEKPIEHDELGCAWSHGDMHFSFNDEQDPIKHIIFVVNQIFCWIELLLHQIRQICYYFLIDFGKSLFSAIHFIHFNDIEIEEMSFEYQISEQLLAEGGPFVSVILHFLFQDLLEGHIVLAQNIVILSAKNFQNWIILSSSKRRPLRIEQDANLAKDRADTKLKKFILYSAISWVIDVDLNRSFAQEVDVFALCTSLYEHVFWLAELGGQLLDQIIKVIHVLEANIAL